MPPIQAVDVTNSALDLKQYTGFCLLSLGSLQIQTGMPVIHPDSQCSSWEEARVALDRQIYEGVAIASPVNMGCVNDVWHVALMCGVGGERTVHALPTVRLTGELYSQLRDLIRKASAQRGYVPGLLSDFSRIVGWKTITHRETSGGKNRRARWLLTCREAALYPYTPKDMQISEQTVFRMAGSIMRSFRKQVC